MKSPDYCILVSTFDKYAPCWEPFIHGLEKYWPEHPEVYFITNELEPPAGRAIKVGKDLGWATNLKNALNQIDAEYILYSQEDYWLQTPVINTMIMDYLRLLDEDKADYIRLYPAHPPDLPSPIDERLGIIDGMSDYRASLQMALWRKSVLNDLINVEETPWQFEVRGSARSNKYENRFLSVSKRKFGIDYVFTAIVNGYWSEEAYAYARQEGLKINFDALPKKPLSKRILDQLVGKGYQMKKKFKSFIKHQRFNRR